MEPYLISLLWLFAGFFCAYQFDYLPTTSEQDEIGLLICVIFAPFALVIGFIKCFFLNKWVK